MILSLLHLNSSQLESDGKCCSIIQKWNYVVSYSILTVFDTFIYKYTIHKLKGVVSFSILYTGPLLYRTNDNTNAMKWLQSNIFLSLSSIIRWHKSFDLFFVQFSMTFTTNENNELMIVHLFDYKCRSLFSINFSTCASIDLHG